jgi:hypothetical protein
MSEEYDKSCRFSNIFLAGLKSIRFENMLKKKKKKKWKGKEKIILGWYLADKIDDQ